MNRHELIQIIKDMIAAPSCCAELKKAGQDYLDADTRETHKTAADNLIREIREDISTIDQAIAFYRSDKALELFGAELQQTKIKQAEAWKEAGGQWCRCDACSAGLEILRYITLVC